MGLQRRWNALFWASGVPGFFDHATDGCPADAVSFCDVGQAHTAAAVEENVLAIDAEWGAADLPALQPGPAHPSAVPLDNKVTFQFRDGARAW